MGIRPPRRTLLGFPSDTCPISSDIVPFHLEGLVAALAVVLCIASRISRTRCRRRILRFRNRPNLALSPFLADMIPSMLNSTLRFRPRPTCLDAIPKSPRAEGTYTFCSRRDCGLPDVILPAWKVRVGALISSTNVEHLTVLVKSISALSKRVQ